MKYFNMGFLYRMEIIIYIRVKNLMFMACNLYKYISIDIAYMILISNRRL